MLFRASNASDLEAKKKNSATVDKHIEMDLVDHCLSKFENSFVNYYNQQKSINRLLSILKTFVNRYISLSKSRVVRDISVFISISA